MTVWSLVYAGFDPGREGLRETLCTLSNGRFTTRGAAEYAEADGCDQSLIMACYWRSQIRNGAGPQSRNATAETR